jgi:hypothetical protein
MRIKITTKFDCTVTGVTGQYRPGKIPFEDKSGTIVNNELSWIKSRNQQRNYESILQLVSLFTQPLNITVPVKKTNHWSWTFDSEYESIFDLDQDRLGLLKKHASGIPMITGLDEQDLTQSVLEPGQNIDFELVKIE